MPIYEYECENHHISSALKKFSESDDPIVCEECGQEAKRILSEGSFILKGQWFKNGGSY